MKFPAVYAKVFEDAIPALARDEIKSAVRTPVANLLLTVTQVSRR